MNYERDFNPPVYFGLRNQGATCYLNSVLQVLFMTKEFKEALRKIASNCGTEFIDKELLNLFNALRRTTGQTTKITQKLGITRVYEQCDAAECFDKILNNTSPQASQVFAGQLTHRNICSECGTERDTDGPFWSLPLTLVDNDNHIYSVTDGIDQYFRPVDISGDNQMYCETCDDKADATAMRVMKHHPDVLTLLLKRFKFDYRYMEHVKIQCNVMIPCILQIPENQTYELYGFVEHFGSLRGGHYTSTIRSQDDDKWYDFNDSMVSELDYQPFQVDRSEISKSAYLLFYRKKKMTSAEETNVGLSAVGKEIRDDGRGVISVTGDRDRKTGSNKQGRKRRSRSRQKHKNEKDPGNQHVVKDTQKRHADDQNSEQEISDKSKRLESPKLNVPKKDEKMVIDDQVEKEGRAAADEKKNVSGSTTSSCKDSRSAGDSKHSMMKNDQESKEVIRNNSHKEDKDERLDAVRLIITQQHKSGEVHHQEVQSVYNQGGEKKVNKKVNAHEGSLQDNRNNGSFRQKRNEDQGSTKKPSDKEHNVNPRHQVKTREEEKLDGKRADEHSHRRGTSERPSSKGVQGRDHRSQDRLELETGEERQSRRAAGENTAGATRYPERKGQSPRPDTTMSNKANRRVTDDEVNDKGERGLNNLDTAAVQCHSPTLNDSPSPKTQNKCTNENTSEIEPLNDPQVEQMTAESDTEVKSTKTKQKKEKSKWRRLKCLFPGCIKKHKD